MLLWNKLNYVHLLEVIVHLYLLKRDFILPFSSFKSAFLQVVAYVQFAATQNFLHANETFYNSIKFKALGKRNKYPDQKLSL